MPNTNALYFGDNLDVLRRHIGDETVNLVYLDPPFNSDANYNVLFRAPSGERSEAQFRAFEDTWEWGEYAETAVADVMRSNSGAAGILNALLGSIGKNELMAYLAMMTVRLIEMHRVLAQNGSIYLHCDPKASHYLKVIIDGIFGPDRFVSEIIWKRTNARGTTGRWPRIHDVILHASKSAKFIFNPAKAKADKTKLPHTLITGADGQKYQTFELTAPGITKDGMSGQKWRGFDPTKLGRHWANTHSTMDQWDDDGAIHWPRDGGFPRRRALEPFNADDRMITVGDVWTDIDRLNQTAKERLGYPTQKPLALLERIILAGSNPGDLVLDPFCGCGTAVHAAEKLGRRWVGIDISHIAVQIIEERLDRHFPNIRGRYRSVGRPTTIDGARELALRDKHQFQSWAVWLAKGRPFGKGPDSGIDGERYFAAGRNKYGRAIISVKGGQHVGPSMVRDLLGTIDRERAQAGIFVSLVSPTRDMKRDAASAGFLDVGDRYPRVQIVTVDELLGGSHAVRLPPSYDNVSVSLEARQAVRRKAMKPDPSRMQKEPEMLFPLQGGRGPSKKGQYQLDVERQDFPMAAEERSAYSPEPVRKRSKSSKRRRG